MLDYDALIQESPEALEAQEKKLRRSAVSYRVRMLRLLKSGESRSLAAAAEQIGYSLTVSRLVQELPSGRSCGGTQV